MVQGTQRVERLVQAGEAAGMEASGRQEGKTEDRGMGSQEVLTEAINQGRPDW